MPPGTHRHVGAPWLRSSSAHDPGRAWSRPSQPGRARTSRLHGLAQHVHVGAQRNRLQRGRSDTDRCGRLRATPTIVPLKERSAKACTPGRSGALRPLSPLRTVGDMFPSYGSSPCEGRREATRLPASAGSLRDTDREPTHRVRRPEVHQWPRPPSFAFLRDVGCPTTLPHRPGAPSSPSLLRPAGFSKLSRDEAPGGRLHPHGSGQRALSAPLRHVKTQNCQGLVDRPRYTVKSRESTLA